MKVKLNEMTTRFAQQSKEHAQVVDEVMRSVNYTLVGWLQSQGFTLT